MGRSYAAVGRFAEAVPCFEVAVKGQPSNPVSYYELADALISSGNDRDAMVPLRQAVLMAPDPV
ncbi:tetratricopeptide repeat protein, partial [Salmonella enterica]|uniref:tetratricopeptide repeat protein n=1 Tax=Salmonella enterica TaxID=28901 RepID=UPI003D294AEC